MTKSEWYYNQFAARLEQAMQDSNLTVKQLAARLGCSEGAVYKWIRGDRLPRIEQLTAICEAVNRSEQWLLGVGSPEISDEVLAEKLIAILDRVMGAGQSFPEALDRETGDPSLLTDEQRQAAASATPAVRALLAKMGGSQWDTLSRQEKLTLSQMLVNLIAEETGE